MTTMTRDQIRNLLLNNRNWVPKDTDPDSLWDLYDDVYQEMEDSGELGAKMKDNDNKKKEDEDNPAPDTYYGDDDDDPYEYEEDEY